MRLFDRFQPESVTGKASSLRAQAMLPACALALCSLTLAAQPSAQPAPGANSATAHRARTHRHPAVVEPVRDPTPAPQPPAPEMPHWPLNDSPAKPNVTWDSHGLRIAAANASLQQILDDVSQATGAKVEGMGPDQRVFGEYGPGEARDILSQLLVGSGYNVLMIGDQGQGTPREIVLSARHAEVKGRQPNQVQNPDMEDEAPEPQEPEEPQQAPPIIPPPGMQAPPGAPKTPQQLLQELQQRQQQMQEQQQQQQLQQMQMPH